ncbi:uncharacterized protein At2g34160-like [Neltuma alba]|uniref:uncharacterized protein At2g34160-like n=1 Tax=Neltuma alba TaxID=207710 RepID=UPI0010A3947A|nr:uncharacterized protein At2g34160-like [Prosopis alba]XP_028804348.1 uncharacterized protein At2g34160-like [Prosopis alba]XP_028804354.1 uncharacterized protein At2g34160-like [Prosopis alba]
MDAIVVVSECKNAAGEQFKNGVHEKHNAVNEGSETATATVTAEPQFYLRKDHQIHVSSSKKPLIFYINLAKKFLNQYNIVELSALGTAITTLIIISENLKRNGLAIEKNVAISTVASKGDQRGRLLHKAKIEILLVKAGQMDQINGATTTKKDANKKAITE